MAAITIRNLEDSLKKRLKIRAAAHDRSMEEEARTILRKALYETGSTQRLGTLIHEKFQQYGGVDLPEPERRESPRKADFSE